MVYHLRAHHSQGNLDWIEDKAYGVGSFVAFIGCSCFGMLSDTDATGEPLEMDPSGSFLMHEQSTNKPCRLSAIGNWLQCQQVIDGVGGVNGVICGKWRRAPLFEVQTDDWECFCSILWDPAHADCAVPQELETGQVLKQLKYIEMLRPRLASKRRKLDETKSRSDVQNLVENTEHKT
ncbi:hypothetical protein SDJN03_16609, partial [Cucurbita argyrosperma subsp. sororia]